LTDDSIADVIEILEIKKWCRTRKDEQETIEKVLKWRSLKQKKGRKND
jgi:hypothetical protein